MSRTPVYLQILLKNIRLLREKASLTEGQLEENLILGPGWIRRFENAETVPSIDMVLAILHETNATLSDLLRGLPEPEPITIDRCIFGEQTANDTIVHFRYANFDAQYRLANSKLNNLESIIKMLRDGLAKLPTSNRKEDAEQNKAIKTNAVASAFIAATKRWPHVNPSDLWWFIIYRAYCDPYNHPSKFARLNFDQSWKRTGGWALEEVLVRHYGAFLKQHGVNLFIADRITKHKLVQMAKFSEHIEEDKIDVVLTGNSPLGQRMFGVVHVKASIAERRTDDVPLSTALISAGFTSPLWTMDCKSTPCTHPHNRGELGANAIHLSAKRKDIEQKGYFTGCFSYNKNTIPSISTLPIEKRVTVCDFNNPNDEFSRFIISRWQQFQKT